MNQSELLRFLVMLRFFACCDPLTAGWVSAKTQLAPYLAIQRFKSLPGLASLIVVGAYGGTLSTVRYLTQAN